MLRNYLLSAWRSFQRDKLFTLLNVLGLAVGLAAALLLFAYVRFELRFDHQHPAYERLMRVSLKLVQEDGTRLFAGNSPSAGPTLVQDFPEVEAFCRVSWRPGFEWLVSRRQQGQTISSFREQSTFFADSNLLRMFHVPLLKGSPAQALQDPHTVLLSEEVAQKLFPTEDPLGKTLYLNGLQGALRVEGVFQLPENMHLQAELIVSRSTLISDASGTFASRYQDKPKGTFFGALDNVYVRLRPGVSPGALAAKVNPFLPTWYQNWFERYRTNHPERRIEYLFTPVSQLRFQSGFTTGSSVLPFPIKNIWEVYFLGIIGALVLLIAWINYINLSTARTIRRAREVGLRKMIGARRRHIMTQFFLETFLVNGCAIVLALTLVQFGYEPLREANGWLPFWDWQAPALWLGIALFWLGGTLLAGFYPALVLASFRPSAMLGGPWVSGKRGSALRRGLVVLQFGMTLGLLLGSFAVYQQMSYLFEQDLGIALEDKLVVKAPLNRDSTYWRSYQLFEQQVKSRKGITAYTASQNLPGDGRFNGLWNMRLKGGKASASAKGGVIGFSGGSVNYDFAEVYDLSFIVGRNFSRQHSTDSTAIILSRQATESLGFTDPAEALGRSIVPSNGAWEAQVIGVIEDYQLISLQNVEQARGSGYDGIALYLYNYLFGYDSYLGFNYFTFEWAEGQGKESLTEIEQVYRASFPGEPFEYFYHLDYFNRQYQPELSFRNTFLFFTLLGIFIACLGLYGLSAFTTQQRTREISIRKVSGASDWQVVQLLSWDYLKLLGFSALIALPVAGTAVHYWLQGFSYHTSLSLGMFVWPLVLVLVLAGMTIASETIRLSRSNPAEMLRHE